MFGGALQVAENPKQEERVCQNTCSSVASYPVGVRGGLLFVWAEAGPTAALESQSRAMPVADWADSMPEGMLMLVVWGCLGKP